MPKDKRIPDNVINPFSDAFLEKWELWKMFKKEAFSFTYKGIISEQMSLKHLVDLSDGDEQKAVKIMEQSMRRQWQGFFPLKETTHGTRQSKSTKDNSTLRERVQSAYNHRFGDGKQPPSESNLKAV